MPLSFSNSVGSSLSDGRSSPLQRKQRRIDAHLSLSRSITLSCFEKLAPSRTLAPILKVTSGDYRSFPSLNTMSNLISEGTGRSLAGEAKRRLELCQVVCRLSMLVLPSVLWPLEKTCRCSCWTLDVAATIPAQSALADGSRGVPGYVRTLRKPRSNKAAAIVSC